MANLEILTTPNPILRTKASPFSKLDKKVPKLIKNMQETLKKSEVPGVGLAAPQVGKPLRIFVVNLPPFVFINPEITWRSKELNTDVVTKEKLFLEGCLSVPKIYALIKRPWVIKVKYQTINQQTADSKQQTAINNKQSKFEGLDSILIQHEIDHLNGVLFTDRALEQGSQVYEVGEDEELCPVVL